MKFMKVLLITVALFSFGTIFITVNTSQYVSGTKEGAPGVNSHKCLLCKNNLYSKL